MNEIKVNTPSSFVFKTTRKLTFGEPGDDPIKEGELYFMGELIAKDAKHFPEMNFPQYNIFNEGTVLFHIPTRQYELIKKQLDPYAAKVSKTKDGQVTTVIIIDSKVRIEDNIKEIKISRPVNRLFKFVITKKSDIN
jgi:hypothetical protein